MTWRDRLRAADWSFWIPAVASVVAVVAVVMSVVDPQWIEHLFEASPDEGSGESEWGITALAVVFALVCLAITSWRWRRIQPAAS